MHLLSQAIESVKFPLHSHHVTAHALARIAPHPCNVNLFPPNSAQIKGEVLADHGDGTFTIKYSDGQTEEDVPEACVRAVATGEEGRSRSASRGGSREREASDGDTRRVWRAVERMAKELAKRAGVQRKKIAFSSLESESDEVQMAFTTFTEDEVLCAVSCTHVKSMTS